MFFYLKEDYIDYVLNVIAKVKLKNNINKVTQIQIQKIIYIVYSYFLIFKSKIANIKFETWKWGPVIYKLWKNHTQYSKSNVPLIFNEKEDLKIDNDFNSENIIVYEIIKFLLNLKYWDIVLICHEQTPWKKLYKPSKNNLITDQDILKFHNENNNNFFEYIDFIVKNVLK
ncbi:type II toxin-antitoxin system antitoxin SocA domain-containing protein [Spiroplasma endosymbiont of Cantharis nigra]|uniref:type II toxin-antitoxin system antitoxin SocA domain-containing protein n=1 Tax=Spiroplasma endosymbiont of Cantharis nigra TaxID=3066278 RepID=UPI0030D415C5